MTLSLIPDPVRRIGGRVRAEMVRTEIVAELRRIARTGRPILAGPWLGEVGFEVLYWVPFLRWVVAEFAIDPTRVIAISRGGPQSWYTGCAGRYVDVFEFLSVDAYRAGNEQRRREVGEQKQVRDSAFDREITGRVRDTADLANAEHLHPALMYRLMQPFWWKHASHSWVAKHTVPALLSRPALPAELGVAPGRYVAVKLYWNDCLVEDERTRHYARQTLAALATHLPVVSLDTGLSLDDHAAADGATDAKHTVASLLTAATNLSVQTAVLANAAAFVGTYGGFSYLAPLHGVPTVSVYSRSFGFDRSHLVVAEHAFARVGAAAFDLCDIGSTPPESIALRVAQLQ
ncbi:MAG TPA: hypothetical protein VNJ02_05035 [Vicinamibacterales bacterium]|nr:hypothetical protein [Vicinamibacterales bacterium]